jgi:hypothetical protein
MKQRTHGLLTALLLAALLMMVIGAPAGAQDAPPVQPVAAPVVAVGVTADGITWTPLIGYPYSSITVTVVDPAGTVKRTAFPMGQTPLLPLMTAGGAPLANGVYNYEVQVTPVVSPEAQAALNAAGESRDNAVVAQLQASGQLPAGPFVQTGTFAVVNGAIVVGDAGAIVAADAGGDPSSDQPRAGDATLDQVIADDLIVQGSFCTGFDCINGENFGFDTIRLKENNLRIHFEDTSAAGFPANDWRIIANDSAGGGANFLAVEDSTASRQIFRLSAGAPANAFFMDSSGRIGLGTSTPVLNLHIGTGNTPAVRMEQTGASGFTAQTWDMGANEANFFIRDVTGGSRLSFRIRPGAPTSSIDIAASGNVGVGTASPNASMHVLRSDGTVQLLVEETSATAAPRDLIKLVNASGNALIRFIRTNSAGSDWRIGSRGANFSIDDSADGLAEFFVAANGNITILGTMTTGGPTCGAGCLQRAELQVQSADVLAKLDAIPLLRWATTASAGNNPDAGEVQVTHLSPDLASFYAVYGLGVDGQSVAPLDVASVALASAQALKATVDAQNAIIAAQNAQIAALEERLSQVEAMAHTHTYIPNVQK